MKRRGFIEALLGALPGAAVALREQALPPALPAPTPLSAADGLSVLGRSCRSTGPMASIVSSADGQVLRYVGDGKLAWGSLDLADTDAVTSLLPLSNPRDGRDT